MILSNFIKVMSTSRLNGTMSKTSHGDLRAYYIAIDSMTIVPFSYYGVSNMKPSNTIISNMGIALSSDTTVPTVDDYRFTNSYTSSDLISVNATLNPGPMQTVLTQTVRNDGTENVVINSVGVFGRHNNPRYETVLLTKTLLDTPVTVAPGEVKTITVTIDYNSFVENVNA